MGIVENDTCNFCNIGDIDFIEHFLFLCPKVKILWREVSKLIWKHKKENTT